MSPAWIPAALLVVLALSGALVLRRLPDRIRIGFDTLCFSAISLYLLKERIVPIFPPLTGGVDGRGLGLRALAGAWWWLGARVIAAALAYVTHRDHRPRGARLFSDLFAAVLYIATVAVIFNSVFALPLTGVLATSGVLAIVLGLALQNSLANVFAGIAVGIESPFSVGDRVLIGDKLEGRIVQVNWRSIRIRTDGDDIAIIPNSIVAKAEIVNRSFPNQHRAASVEISCPEGSLPERVIDALRIATVLCPHILRQPEPEASLLRLGSRRNTYEISFVVSSTEDLAATKDVLLRGARRQLHYAGLLESSADGAAAPGRDEADSSAARRLLGDLVLFECLDGDQIEGLAREVEPRRLDPGQVLFCEGDDDASLYVVAAGILEFSRHAQSAPEIIGCIGAGEYVGEIGLLTGAPHAATASARTSSKIYRLRRDSIAPLLSKNPELAAAFDRSARHGLSILHRDVAVRATPPIGAAGQLLARIRKAFHTGAGHARDEQRPNDEQRPGSHPTS